MHCDPDGALTGSYEQLVRPAKAADPTLGGYGTGAVHVHGIGWDDVSGAPAWEQVAPAAAAQLQNRILVAHNWPFERAWLATHLAPLTTYEPWPDAVDTLAVARQHRPDLPDRKLHTVSAHLHVPYDDGHRALHDARACAEVLFAFRRALAQDWAACPARARTAAPRAGTGTASRSKVDRLRAGCPELTDDAWTHPAAVRP